MDCIDHPWALLRGMSPGESMDFPAGEFEVHVTGAVGVEGVKVIGQRQRVEASQS